MRVLVAACGAARLPLMLAVRLEDARQRHPNDRAPEVPAAAVRALVRCDADVRLVVTHADRAFVEEVHFGSADRKSTRLNSSHGYISYAVFCLKKKKDPRPARPPEQDHVTLQRLNPPLRCDVDHPQERALVALYVASLPKVCRGGRLVRVV